MKSNLRLLTVLFFTCSFSFFTRAQSWLWAKPANGSCVSADSYGNAYVSGGPLVKYDTTGKVCWTAQPVMKSKFSNISGMGSAADAKGNVYVTGGFNDSIEFGSYLLPGVDQIFLARYNTNGVVKWAKQTNYTGGTYEVEVCSVGTDNRGNAIVTGTFTGSILFGNDTVSSISNFSVFIAKYDSNGNALWAKAPVANPTGLTEGVCISTDDSGNIFVAGHFEGSLMFGTTILSNFSGIDIFLVKYAPDGTFLWGRQGTNATFGGGISITTDKAGYTYITGDFADSVRFGNTNLYSTAYGKIFLVKYDEAGNMVWAKTNLGGVWGGFALSSDAQNHIYLTCYQWVDNLPDTFQFGGYSYIAPIFSYDTSDRLILQCDTSGKVLSSAHFSGSGGCCCYGENIAAAPSGNFVYVSGGMPFTTVFGPDTIIAGGSSFIARWAPDAVSEGIAPTVSNNSQLIVYPNPSNGVFTFEMKNEELVMKNIEVYNVLGEKVYSTNYSPFANHHSLDLSTQPNGIYLYRVLTETGNLIGEGKIVVQK